MSLIKNTIFVHIPKSGRTSVRHFIQSQVEKEDIFPEPDLNHFPRYSELNVIRPMLFMSHLGFDFVREAKGDVLVLMLWMPPLDGITCAIMVSYEPEPIRGRHPQHQLKSNNDGVLF